jgi:tetratricopeptide (TPR) repeat protein
MPAPPRAPAYARPQETDRDTWSSPLDEATTFLPSRPSQGPASPADVSSTFRPTTFAPGELLSERYRIERFVAIGGMGEVYEALDTSLGQRVALKVIRADVVSDPGALERFKREVHVARRVTHRNVCRIYDLGTHRSSGSIGRLYPGGVIPFVSMELLEGESLNERLARTAPLTLEEAIPLAEQMAAALEEAHANGIVHRDLKPANVMLVPTEEGERVVVTDFGLARAAAESGQTVTVAGSAMGSPAYMAPEQVQGVDVGPAADLYAFGVVLYEMATGRVPFKGDTPIATAVQRLSEPPPPPSTHRADLDPRWEAVILRCLQRAPEARFSSAGEVARALRGEEAVAAGPARRTVVLALVAGFLIALAAAVNFVVWKGRSERADNPYLGLESSGRPSVAILSLENLTGREEVAWLSTGLAEMLGTELSSGGAVRVIPREDVARVRRELGLSEIDSVPGAAVADLQESLGAGYLISGGYTVVGSGGDPRVRLDLTLRPDDAGEPSTVSVEGLESEVFDLVNEAGRDLLRALEIETREAEQTFRWASREAARTYSEGLDLAEAEELEAARRKLEAAAAVDPRNPRIRVALASVLQRLGFEEQARAELGLAAELADALPPGERLEVRARSLEANGRLDEAAKAFDELWRRFPDDLEHGLALAGTLTAAGRPAEAAQVVEALERQHRKAPDPRIFFQAASAAASQGDFRRQQEAAARAGEVARSQDASLQLAEARLLEGWAWRNLGDPARARRLTEEASALYAAMGDRSGEARARVQEATLLYDQGNLDAARTAFEETLERYRELGDRGQEAKVLNNLAVVLRQQGEPDRALELYDEVLSLAREIGSRSGMAQAQNNLGALRLTRGELTDARARFGEAISIAREIGDRSQEASALYNLALVLRRLGTLDDAEGRQREALALRLEMGQRLGEAASLADLGTISLEQGRLEEAIARYQEALEVARATENRRLEAYALFGLGQARFEQGRLDVAEERHERALAIREELGEGSTAAESRLALAGLDLERGWAVAAREKLDAVIPALDAESARDAVALARSMRARALALDDQEEAAREEIERALARARTSEDLGSSLRMRLEVARAERSLGQPEVALAEARAVGERARESGIIPIFLEAQLLVSDLLTDPEEARHVRAEVRAEAIAIGFERLGEMAGDEI